MLKFAVNTSPHQSLSSNGISDGLLVALKSAIFNRKMAFMLQFAVISNGISNGLLVVAGRPHQSSAMELPTCRTSARRGAWTICSVLCIYMPAIDRSLLIAVVSRVARVVC